MLLSDIHHVTELGPSNTCHDSRRRYSYYALDGIMITKTEDGREGKMLYRWLRWFNLVTMVHDLRQSDIEIHIINDSYV